MIIKYFVRFLLLSGLALVAFGVYYAFFAAEARSWPSVEGKVASVVVKSEILSAGSSSYTEASRERLRYYYPAITYAYTVEGQGYAGSQYRLGQGDASEKYKQRADAVAAATRYKNGDPITVYYDPANPGTAVLDRSTGWGVYVPLILGAFLLGSGLLFWRFEDALVVAPSP